MIIMINFVILISFIFIYF